MPWRVPRRWWCGCDGSGVRRRRVRGRRGWRGGVGCGWHRFTHWAVAVPGVVAVLPGAVAPERAPRLQGLAPGPGRRRLRRRSPRLRPMRPVPSSTSRPAWAMDRHWPPWWCRALEVAAVAVLAPPDRLPGGADRVVGAPCGCWWPSRRCGGRTGPVTKAVQQNPDQVGTRVKSTTQRRFGRAAAGVAAQRAERGPGSPWRARWCAPSCPARRRPDSGARMRRTRGACGPPRGPPAGSPAAARSSRKSPAPASKRLGPPGRGSPLDPGATSEIDLLEGGRDRAA